MKIIEKNGYKIIMSDRLCALSDCVIALGNFDGIHVAHATLLSKARELAQNIGAGCVGAWCFEKNPIEFITSHAVPSIITNEQRIKLFFEHGMDFVVIADFSVFRNISCNDFMSIYLSGELGCIGAVCGYNFKFGLDRMGTPELLGEHFGYENVCIIDRISIDGITVSSSEIRRLIADGDIERTNQFLGRPFSLSAPVTLGIQLGRQLGFPTANQHFPVNSITPKHAIYVSVCTTEDEKKYVGVSNVGTRPTIDHQSDLHEVNCETYIIDFDKDIYGQNLTVEFFHMLREEKKFTSVDLLRQAISNDAKNAVRYFEGSEGLK